jgi:demethylspheroidene O-methyltransferase
VKLVDAIAGARWRHPPGRTDAFHRLLASARFRRLATAFPLTRPIARRRAAALFDLCAGFVYSQVLSATVASHLPQALLRAPGNAAEIGQRIGLTQDAAARLLDAAVALRIARRRRRDGRYALGPLGAALIDNPGVVAMITHHDMLYDDLRDPLALLRGDRHETSLQRYWDYSPDTTRLQASPYSALMAASQAMVRDEILSAYDIGRHRCLLDVGGGDGSFLISAAKCAPAARLLLFDLPAVAELARQNFEQTGLASRAHAVGGSFHHDPLPNDADLVTLIRVLHDDEAAAAILRAVRKSLKPGATLLIAEPMSGTRGAEASGDAYFGFYLMAMGSGRPRTPARIKQMLREAGFGRSRLLSTRTPLVARIILAFP